MNTAAHPDLIRINNRLVLRQRRPEDAEDLFALMDANRTILREWMPWLDGCTSPDHARENIESALRAAEAGTALAVAIWEDGRIVGVTGFNEINRAKRVGHIGYWLGEAQQGRGIMTASVRALVDYGFEKLGLNRQVIRAATGNTRSRAVAERLSFVLEGIAHEAEWLYDRFVDQAVYAMTRSAWAGARDATERGTIDLQHLANGGWPMPRPLTLRGRYFTLTPLDLDADVDELFHGSHDASTFEAMWRYVSAGPFADAVAMRVWMRERQALPDMIVFTTTDNATGRRIGSISLMRITPAHGVAELGFIWVEPAAQRTKANTEANYLLLRHCFADLGYRRMEWKCHAGNEPSKRAALRLGYRYEGTFRQHLVAKGRSRDTAWFAMLDHEWPRIGAAMERWLYTEDSAPLAALRDAGE